MAGELSRRWGLLLNTRQPSVDAGPLRRARRPNGHGGGCKIRLVKASNPNEYQVRACLSLAEQRSTARRAKSPMHAVAAVRGAREVAHLPYHLERRRAKASSHRPASCPKVLAVAAPANARSNGRFLTLPTNRTAKASSSHCHSALQGLVRRHCAWQIVRLAASLAQLSSSTNLLFTPNLQTP
jgi:hypothetical protein